MNNQYKRHARNVRGCCTEQQLADLGLARPQSWRRRASHVLGETLAAISLVALALWCSYVLHY